jgi:hypothetical protein
MNVADQKMTAYMISKRPHVAATSIRPQLIRASKSGTDTYEGSATNKNTTMNKTTLSILAATITAAFAVADEVKTTTTTTTIGNGTVTEYSPGSTFVVKETSGPVTYRYGKKVTYVTKTGKTLTDDEVRTRIKVGVPVHVYYGLEGDARVISRVELDED